jgi:type IV pilus assembly protein PilC
VFSRSEVGRAFFSWVKLGIPLYRRQLNLRLVQVLALMLKAGQAISVILPLCADMVENEGVRRDLTRVNNDLAAGRPFWESLNTLTYIDPLLVSMVRVGEESGALAQTVESCTQHFESGYRAALRRVNKLVEPLITIVLGVILAVVMLAVVLPTFTLATAI